LTPLSFTHIPPPLPRSSRKMLSTLSSPSGFGLRLAPTISTGTLGFSRLARRSIFIVVCTLADSLHEPFASRASTGKSFYRIASTASGWNVSCRAGYLPPAGFRRPFTARRSFALPTPETTRGCPAQAEPRPTCADASRVNLHLSLTLMGFSLGKHEKPCGPEGAGATRWFTDVSVTRNSTMFLLRMKARFFP